MQTNFTPCQIKVVKEILHQVMSQQHIMEEVCLAVQKHGKYKGQQRIWDNKNNKEIIDIIEIC